MTISQDDMAKLGERLKRLSCENGLLNAAFENMAQAVCMFDSEARLVFANKRYAAIYGLPRESLVPGITLPEIVRMRVDGGNIAGDNVEAYVAEREQWLRDRTRTRSLHQLSDGRTVAVERRFLGDGGWIATHTDMTEHLALQDELRDSRERHTRLLETLNIIPWEFDWAAQRFVYVGPQAAQFGYPIEDWYRDGFWTHIIHPDDRTDAVDFCVAATERGQDHDFEYRVVKADGSICWIRDIVSVVTNAGGSPFLRGVFVDIGEQKQAEQDRKQRESELQQIFDNVPVRIIYKDDNNRLLRVNEHAARSMGLSVEEAEGASAYDLFPEMAKKYHEDDLEVINSNTPKLGIVQPYTPRNGERGWVVTDKVPLIDEETGKRFVFASSVDITAQKLAEQELRTSKARFKDIAETASDWFWETDRHHRFTYISKRFHEMTGVEPDKILGHSRFELAGGSGPDWDEHMADLQARRPFRDFRYQVANDRGETRYWSTSGKPIFAEDGTFIGYRGSGSDRTIEERALKVLSRSHDQLQESVQRATAELRAKTEKLAQALAKEKELNELQRQFVSMASHEFRTPLAIIDSTAQRLKSRAEKLTPAETVRRVDGIRQAVQRMTRLMESTLTAARMEKGKVAVEIAACDLRKVVAEVCQRQQDIADDHLIACDLAELPETIQADSDALEQVLTNLVSNAVKYSPNAPHIEVKGSRDGDDAVISVRDHGLGIDAEDLPRMFERFFRAKTSTGIAGTGIGLNLVKALVEMHGGTVGVESEVDKGSRFTIRLPISGPKETGQTGRRAA